MKRPIYFILVALLMVSCRDDTIASDHSFGKGYASGGRYFGYNPVMDPEQQVIFFGCPTDGRLGDICAIGIDNQQLRMLTQTEYYIGQPALSPDGASLAFVAEPDGSTPSIHRMDLNTQEVTRLTTPRYRDHSPVFSQDGQWIAFTRHMSAGPDDLWSEEIFIVRVDGTGERRLTDNTLAERPIAFGENDKDLYFARVDADLLNREFVIRWDLYRMAIDTGAIELILPLKIRGPVFAVSYDEKYVAYVDDEEFAYDVFLYSVETSDIRRLTEMRGLVQSVSFARGSNKLITCEIEPKGGHPKSLADILVIDAAGPEVKRITWGAEMGSLLNSRGRDSEEDWRGRQQQPGRGGH